MPLVKKKSIKFKVTDEMVAGFLDNLNIRHSVGLLGITNAREIESAAQEILRQVVEGRLAADDSLLAKALKTSDVPVADLFAYYKGANPC